MNIDTLHTYITTEILNDAQLAIGADDDLLLMGILDSLGVMRLIAHIDDTLGIDVPPEDVTLENFGSLRQIEAYLARFTPSVAV